MQIGIIDAVTFIAYIVAVVSIGLAVGRGERGSTEDYFLAGKRLPWFAIGTSIIAASISTEQFIGEVGFAYRYGLAVANWEWAVFPAFTILIFVFMPYYFNNNIRTMPEFLERRFDHRVGAVFALLTVLSYVFINMAGVIYSGGYFLEKIFGIDKIILMWILAGMGGVFTIYGGLSAVVWTDLLQASLLLGGGMLVFVLGVFAVPGGLDQIIGTGERSHLILPSSHPDLPWTAILVIAISTNVWYYATNQYINQRCLGARTQWDARMGIIFAGFLGIPLALIVSFPGMIAYALDPNLQEADQAYPHLLITLVPLGLRGLVIAALAAAITSTFNSLLNSSATIMTLDIYKRFIRPRATDRQLVRFGQICGIGILLVGATWAPMVEKFGSIFAFFQEAWALFAAPIVAVFTFGIFWRRVTSTAAFWTLLLCFPVFALAYIRRAIEWDINPYNLGGFVLLFSIVFLLGLSQLTMKPDGKSYSGNLWNHSLLTLPKEENQERKGIANQFILWWAVMIIIYVGIYALYW